MARFSLKSTLFSVLLLIIFVLTISQFKHENPPHPKTNPDLQQKSGEALPLSYSREDFNRTMRAKLEGECKAMHQLGLRPLG